MKSTFKEDPCVQTFICETFLSENVFQNGIVFLYLEYGVIYTFSDFKDQKTLQMHRALSTFRDTREKILSLSCHIHFDHF